VKIEINMSPGANMNQSQSIREKNFIIDEEITELLPFNIDI
jgi:hypothetical protein